MKITRVERIKKNCLSCGHNRMFHKQGEIVSGKFCTKCHSSAMKYEKVKNKHKKFINKKVME